MLRTRKCYPVYFFILIRSTHSARKIPPPGAPYRRFFGTFSLQQHVYELPHGHECMMSAFGKLQSRDILVTTTSTFFCSKLRNVFVYVSLLVRKLCLLWCTRVWSSNVLVGRHARASGRTSKSLVEIRVRVLPAYQVHTGSSLHENNATINSEQQQQANR